MVDAWKLSAASIAARPVRRHVFLGPAGLRPGLPCGLALNQHPSSIRPGPWPTPARPGRGRPRVGRRPDSGQESCKGLSDRSIGSVRNRPRFHASPNSHAPSGRFKRCHARSFRAPRRTTAPGRVCFREKEMCSLEAGRRATARPSRRSPPANGAPAPRVATRTAPSLSKSTLRAPKSTSPLGLDSRGCRRRSRWLPSDPK